MKPARPAVVWITLGANNFRGGRGDDAPGEAVGLIVGAIRRSCGPLPPYPEAASLYTADPSPS